MFFLHLSFSLLFLLEGRIEEIFFLFLNHPGIFLQLLLFYYILNNSRYHIGRAQLLVSFNGAFAQLTSPLK